MWYLINKYEFYDRSWIKVDTFISKTNNWKSSNEIKFEITSIKVKNK